MLNLSKTYLKTDINDFLESDIPKFQNLVSFHSDLYYNKEEPIISDYEYDELLNKLSQLEEKFWVTTKQSTLIWAEVLESTFEKVKHSRPMISLDNTYNEEDLNDFNKRVLKNLTPPSIPPLQGEGRKMKYSLEYKFDWLGVELIYKNWELTQAITRGNWVEWEDVTVNVMQIKNIPKTITYKKHLEVRGEVVMPISVFEWLNEKAKIEWTKIFANPRNAASWSLRMKDASVTKQRKLKFFAYDLANFDEYRLDIKVFDYFLVIKSLEKLNFEISSYFEIFDWIEKVIKKIEKFWDYKKWIDFEVDWLVLKVNDVSLWNEIWFTEHHPKYAIAYKFPAEIFTTEIISIDYQVWRTWTITPVANLEPINMWWAVIRRATLHNFEEVEKLDVKIWDTVFIKRAGEVIPKIISVSVSWEWKQITPPEFCPSCETKVLKDDGKVRYYCPNNVDCPAKHHEKLAFAVGKQWFNIDWLWTRQVDIFLREWIIHNLTDIFKISEKSDEILELEWFQEKSVENLIAWVEKAKDIDISTLLTALWIAWVGKKTAKTISVLFKNREELINFTWNIEEIENLEDIWPEIAKNLIEYFENEAHRKILNDLTNILNIKYYEKIEINQDSYFFWKKVCITWSFEQDWKKISRNELVKKLETAWWNFMSSVTKKTDYVLAWNKAWSKLKKANTLWVEILKLTDFLNYL